MPIIDFIKDHGVAFSIIRSGVAIASEKGLSDYDNVRKEKCIIFLPAVDIKEGDALTFTDGKTVFVSEIFPQYVHGKIEFYRAYYKTKKEMEESTQPGPTVFNIGSVTNSVVGNNNTVTISIQEMRDRAEQEGGTDKEALQEIISILEKILAGQETPKQGLFKKFSACMERNSWITGAIASALLGWLL